MKVDFERIEVYVDIEKKQCIVQNVKVDMANMLYQNGFGIATHALAFKIFNSNVETEYNEEECKIIRDNISRFCTPNLIDAINSLFDVQKKDK